MTKTQNDNWHTLDQIKAMGNRVIVNKTNEGETYSLATQRGKTITYWIENEDDQYYPVTCKTID